MNKIKLKEVVSFSNERIAYDDLKIETYISTDNLLQNKEGIIQSSQLPASIINTPKYNKGNILVSNIRPYLKKIYYSKQDGGVSSDVLTFVVKETFESKYVYYSLFQDVFFEHMMIGSKGTKMPRGDKNQILEFEIPNFTISTQQKIASVLSALDDKIELNNNINAELEQMAKTLYDYWFVQFDFPNKEGKPYKSSGGKMKYNNILKREIPEGWEVMKLDEIIEVKDGTHDSPKYINENGYSLVTSKNLKKTGIDFSETNKISKIDFDLVNQRSKVDTGDILFSMIGSIGTIYKVEETVIEFAIKNVALFKTSQNLELKNFIYQYLHSYDMQRYLPNVISGSIQKFVGLGSLRNIPILFDLGIINLFNKESKSLFEKMNNIVQQNKELASLRDWLLPMLMNGQVKVTD